MVPQSRRIVKMKDVLDDPDKKKAMLAKFNPTQYQGLLKQITTLKDQVEEERIEIAQKQRAAEKGLREREAQAKVIKKELASQLGIANKGYQVVLEENTKIRAEIEEVKARAKEEIAEVKAQIKEERAEVKTNEIAAKKEVEKAKAEVEKYKARQVDISDQVKEWNLKIQKAEFENQKKLDEQEIAYKKLLVEVEAVKVEAEKKVEESKEGKLELKQEIVFLKQQVHEVEQKSEWKDGLVTTLHKTIEGLKQEVVQVKASIVAPDHTPFQKMIDQKEHAYMKLVEDFDRMHRRHEKEIHEVKEHYEEMIKSLNTEIKTTKQELNRSRAYVDRQLQERETVIEELKEKMVETKAHDDKLHEEAAEREALLSKDLGIAQETVQRLADEVNMLKRRIELAEKKEEVIKVEGEKPSKVKMVQMQMEQLAEDCKVMLERKDEDLVKTMESVAELQRKLAVEKEAIAKQDRLWEERVVEKEKGFEAMLGDFRYLEGKLAEEKAEVSRQEGEVRKREQIIERMMEEHEREIEDYKAMREELEQDKRKLRREIKDLEHAKQVQKEDYERKIKGIEERAADREDHLKKMIADRDEKYRELQKQHDETLQKWAEDKEAVEERERQLEMDIRMKEREIKKLEGEMEMFKEQAEDRYNRLLKRCEQLQRMYDEAVGPGGAAETKKRAAALEEEILRLQGVVHERDEYIVRQRKMIREKELEIDEVQKETADLIHIKEQAYSQLSKEHQTLQHQMGEELRKAAEKHDELHNRLMAKISEFNKTVKRLEEEKEALRFNDRDELLAQVAHFKKMWELKIQEKRDAEEEFEEKLEVKENTLQEIIKQNAACRKQIEKLEEEVQETKDNCEKAVSRVNQKMTMDHEEQDGKFRELAEEKRQLQEFVDHQKEVMQAALENDPEKIKLRQDLKDHETSQVATAKVISELGEEITQLKDKIDTMDVIVAEEKEKQGKLMKKHESKYAEMEKEQEELKALLHMEMTKAERACKQLEQRFRELPNPFEEEVLDLKEKYAETQRGLETLMLDNQKLQDLIETERREFGHQKNALEEKVVMMTTVLNEMSSLGEEGALSLGGGDSRDPQQLAALLAGQSSAQLT